VRVAHNGSVYRRSEARFFQRKVIRDLIFFVVDTIVSGGARLIAASRGAADEEDRNRDCHKDDHIGKDPRVRTGLSRLGRGAGRAGGGQGGRGDTEPNGRGRDQVSKLIEQAG
jgi:hypothetical protein